MSKFRSAHRTIVTELKTFVVDKVSRTGAFRQSVSAKVDEEVQFDRRDFNVSKANHFEIDNAENVLGISTPEPVLVEFIQSEPAFKEVEAQAPVYTKAEIATEPTCKVGFPIEYDIRDPDLFTNINEIDTVVYNKASGETEYLKARNYGTEGLYKAYIDTIPSVEKGEDFDNSLNVGHNAIVELIYHDVTVSGSEDPTVRKNIRFISPFVGMKLETPQLIFPDELLPIRIQFDDFEGLGILHINVINMSSGETEIVDLTETNPGEFYGYINTQLRTDTNAIQGDYKLSVRTGDMLHITMTTDLSLICSDCQKYTSVLDEVNITGNLVSPDNALIGDMVTVSLHDYNLRGRQVINLPVSNERTGDFILVPFHEIMPNFGVFKATFNIAESNTGFSQTNIPASPSDRIKITYIDSDSPNNPFNRIEQYIDVTEEVPVDDVDITEPGGIEIPVIDYGTVSFYVDGLFYLNGMYKGKIIIRGMNEDNTRCVLIRS